jgi:hypothetical protein
MRRTAAKRSPGPERDWSEALAKVHGERTCRACGRPGWEVRVEAAHVIGRAQADETHPDGSGRLIVRGVDVVPLCAPCHRAYDAHQLNLLPHLTPAEQTRAVQVAGGIVAAMQRTTGLRWAPVAPRTAPPTTEA